MRFASLAAAVGAMPWSSKPVPPGFCSTVDSARRDDRPSRPPWPHPRRSVGRRRHHEHEDHIGGVARLARRHSIPVWLTHGTLTGFEALFSGIGNLHLIDNYGSFSVGDLRSNRFRCRTMRASRRSTYSAMARAGSGCSRTPVVPRRTSRPCCRLRRPGAGMQSRSRNAASEQLSAETARTHRRALRPSR